MSNRYPDHGPERPRSEPEIIPPGADGGPQSEFSGIWIRVDERDGVRRVYLKRPGLFSIILTLLGISLIVAVVLVLLAGLMLIWLPLAIIIVGAFLFSGYARYYWYRFSAWLHGR
jgi:hypothetical protein